MQASDICLDLSSLRSQKSPPDSTSRKRDYRGLSRHREPPYARASGSFFHVCFGRFITGNNNIPSIHSYGLAIDINPIQNPYITSKEQEENHIKILPNSGKEYINRNNILPGMVESVVEILKKNGFKDWGGMWIYPRPIDWQHFQLPRPLAQLLSVMTPTHGKEFFEMYTIAQSQIFHYGEYDPIETNKFVELYRKNPKKFMKIFKNRKNIFGMNTAEALKEIVISVG